jgi:eukaryotic-like serine/threonine-protein kinase
MSPEQYEAVKHLFAAVAELRPEARAAALAKLTGDADVIAEVLALHGVSTSTTLVWQPIASALNEAATPEIAPGDSLGVWRIASEIGRGGMARVFLAERNDGHFEQRAALKVLRGVPSLQALALFSRERQLLANLGHPNIARLLDGGATPEQQPYLVMEYVEGAHIDEHCHREQLGVEAILALFLTACEAVAFAHRRLVIHCDLKPSNLLIDSGGRPVLLDFGIAHLLGSVETGPPAAAHPPAQAQAPRAFTPRYASPEQIAHGALSTASDIHSLGVILGELLAEAADRQRLAELRRRELAAIVARATRRDPAERYATVDALTAEIRRFRGRRPLAEWHGQRGYALRKLLVRRWPTLATALLLATTVATAAAQVLWESRLAQAAEMSAQAAETKAVSDRNRAALAEAASRQTSDFLVSIFRASLAAGPAAPVPASTLVAQAEERLETELQGQPSALADIHGALARVQANMASPGKARQHFLRAIALERGLDRPLSLARLLVDLTALRLANSDAAGGEADAREALALAERHAGPKTKLAIEARQRLAEMLRRRDKDARAADLLQRGAENAAPPPAQGVGLKAAARY